MLISALFASGASAGEGGGGLVGWVESSHGTPVAGAVISVFGKGMGNGGFVTLTDSAGQFVLPRLPAGSYTLRALDSGHVPYPAQKFTVLPDRDATFTVSLTPIGETASPATAPGAGGPALAEDENAAALREWRWLLRHKRRSVLEDRSEDPLPAGAIRVADAMPLRSAGPWFTDLGGSVELVASPVGAFLPADVSMAGQGALRLRGRLADGIQWNLGGLVTE
ncbi:MAG TPA: carboxypeptidase-like regulatory domain-containing protein, partial [Vicinamibacteria bacterium]